MKIRLYSIKDRLLGAYLAPFSARADVEAVRQLRASMQDPSMAKSQLVLAPQDYSLHYVGTFDDETGLLFDDQTVTDISTGKLRLPQLVIELSKINASEVVYAEKMVTGEPVQS